MKIKYTPELNEALTADRAESGYSYIKFLKRNGLYPVHNFNYLKIIDKEKAGMIILKYSDIIEFSKT